MSTHMKGSTSDEGHACVLCGWQQGLAGSAAVGVLGQGVIVVEEGDGEDGHDRNSHASQDHGAQRGLAPGVAAQVEQQGRQQRPNRARQVVAAVQERVDAVPPACDKEDAPSVPSIPAYPSGW